MDTIALIPPQIAPFAAFLLAIAIIPLAGKFGKKIGLVDHPGGRKQHDGSIPLVGGLAIFPVFMIISLLSGLDIAFYWPLFAGLAVILTIGAIDDHHDINPWYKFGAQFVAAGLIVIFGSAELKSLGNMFGLGVMHLGLISIPFSVIATVLLVNAINLMDGLDGLAAGKSFVVLTWLMIACLLAHQWPPFWDIGIILGALGGFLVYNMRTPFRKKASVFLGDAGSMGLGLALAWFSIGLAQEPDPILTPISIAWILALPIIDACGQFNRRVREGRHPFSPDRGHFHHHFVHAGLPIGKSTALILLVAFLLGGVGVIGVLLGVPLPILTIAWIILLFSHMALSYKPERYVIMIEKFTKSARGKQISSEEE